MPSWPSCDCKHTMVALALEFTILLAARTACAALVAPSDIPCDTLQPLSRHVPSWPRKHPLASAAAIRRLTRCHMAVSGVSQNAEYRERALFASWRLKFDRLSDTKTDQSGANGSEY